MTLNMLVLKIGLLALKEENFWPNKSGRLIPMSTPKNIDSVPDLMLSKVNTLIMSN